MAILNAFTPNTARNLQLDAGILVLGLVNPGAFAGELPVGTKKLGATSGGGKFVAQPTYRSLFEGIDGAKGVYKDGQTIDSWDIKLTTTLKEMSKESLLLALGAADAVETSGTSVISGRLNMLSSDYFKNVCWLGTVNGSNKPMIIELFNVLNVSGMSFAFADKATGGVELELVAHFDVMDPNTVPFKIYMPTVEQMQLD